MQGWSGGMNCALGLACTALNPKTARFQKKKMEGRSQGGGSAVTKTLRTKIY